MLRYFSFLAYESRAIGEAARLWWRSLSTDPGAAVLDQRSWKLGAAIAAASILPERILQMLEAGTIRGTA